MSLSETGGHQSVKTVGPHWGLVNCLYGPSPGRKTIARLSADSRSLFWTADRF